MAQLWYCPRIFYVFSIETVISQQILSYWKLRLWSLWMIINICSYIHNEMNCWVLVFVSSLYCDYFQYTGLYRVWNQENIFLTKRTVFIKFSKLSWMAHCHQLRGGHYEHLIFFDSTSFFKWIQLFVKFIHPCVVMNWFMGNWI